jgi:hypothetical protein
VSVTSVEKWNITGSFSGGQFRSLHGTLKNANLVTKGEILEL